MIMSPEVKIRLFKTMSRRVVATTDGRTVPASERYSGGERVIDITPFLGDGGAVETSKSVRQPAGNWALTLTDQMETGHLDSLYGLIEPMDVVEIRMRHRPDVAASGAEPPIVMRGFVCNVGRTMSMGANGAPARAVTLSGMDYGKILEMIQIRYLPNYVIGQNLLTILNMFVNYGVEAKPNQAGGDFVRQIVELVINPFISGLSGFGAANEKGMSFMRTMGVETTATAATISAFGAQSAQGTLWDVLRQFLDVGPWTELFVEDRPDEMADPKRSGGVVLVYRNNPFKDLDPAKGYIMPMPIEPDTLTVADADVIQVAPMRSDQNVANYFQVNMPRMGLIDAGAMSLAGQSSDPNSFYLANYENATPKLYGLRFMEADTQMGGADGLGRIDGQSAAAVAEGEGKGRLWIDRRRAELMAMNKDNVVFESGTITLRGQATLRAGMILKVVHGPQSAENATLKPFMWECYVVQVQQRLIPYQGFVTVATFERGTAFAERIRRASGVESAYLAEWSQRGAVGG